MSSSTTAISDRIVRRFSEHDVYNIYNTHLAIFTATVVWKVKKRHTIQKNLSIYFRSNLLQYLEC